MEKPQANGASHWHGFANERPRRGQRAFANYFIGRLQVLDLPKINLILEVAGSVSIYGNDLSFGDETKRGVEFCHSTRDVLIILLSQKSLSARFLCYSALCGTYREKGEDKEILEFRNSFPQFLRNSRDIESTGGAQC